MTSSKRTNLTTQSSEPRIIVAIEQSPPVTTPKLSENLPQTLSEEDSSSSPTINPYFLSPFAREVRKSSLPTPQCSGITASQVRRLSERGESSPGPKQAEFLATLSSTTSKSSRRHSVVTISKLPQNLFGRHRRESVACTPSTFRVLPNRRESIACPPSTEPRGSVHNLQLDIMDDIVQARKVRMKLWNSSKEKLCCEVQTLDEGTPVATQRYNSSTTVSRRFSEFVGTTLPPILSGSTKRRASEAVTKVRSGIICTNTDLISILGSLSTSATEINQMGAEVVSKLTGSNSGGLKNSRSSSFDISELQASLSQKTTPTQWFTKRHQPIYNKPTSETCSAKTPTRKLNWDDLIDANAIGSAIEGFLRQSTSSGSGKIKSKDVKKKYY